MSRLRVSTRSEDDFGAEIEFQNQGLEANIISLRYHTNAVVVGSLKMGWNHHR